jgi:hypothetical protein
MSQVRAASREANTHGEHTDDRTDEWPQEDDRTDDAQQMEEEEEEEDPETLLSHFQLEAEEEEEEVDTRVEEEVDAAALADGPDVRDGSDFASDWMPAGNGVPTAPAGDEPMYDDEPMYQGSYQGPMGGVGCSGDGHAAAGAGLVAPSPPLGWGGNGSERRVGEEGAGHPAKGGSEPDF